MRRHEIGALLDPRQRQRDDATAKPGIGLGHDPGGRLGLLPVLPALDVAGEDRVPIGGEEHPPVIATPPRRRRDMRRGRRSRRTYAGPCAIHDLPEGGMRRRAGAGSRGSLVPNASGGKKPASAPIRNGGRLCPRRPPASAIRGKAGRGTLAFGGESRRLPPFSGRGGTPHQRQAESRKPASAFRKEGSADQVKALGRRSQSG